MQDFVKSKVVLKLLGFVGMIDARGGFQVHLLHVMRLLHLGFINTTSKMISAICRLTDEILIEKNLKNIYS